MSVISIKIDGSGLDGGKAVLAAFNKQIGWCDSLGAPFTARLLTLLAEDIARGGPAAGMVAAWTGDPVADALPLRLAGAFHAFVLTGAEPDLAACYPPGDDGDPGRLRAAVSAALARRGGFLHIAGSTRLPLRLLEIGSSAGLNLIWDRYHYRLGDGRWGDPASPVRLEPEWEGPLPPLGTLLDVAERAGCDVVPVDLGRREDRLRLRGYVWADQPERLARIDAAVAVARQVGVVVERADAGAWVRDRLAAPTPGQATVLFHSIMWQYMPGATQAAVRDAIDQAGARVIEAGERQHRLAIAHPHGKIVRWLGT